MKEIEGYERRFWDEPEKLWDEDLEVSGRKRVMQGGILDGVFYLLQHFALFEQRGAVDLATRAAWLGYCIGSGLIKDREPRTEEEMLS